MEYIYNNKDKYDIMIDGLTLVKPQLQKEWLEFVDNNYITENNKSAVIDCVLLMMALIERGMSFWEAERFVYSEQYDNVYDICSRSIGLVTHFSKKGNEYLEYLNDRDSYKLKNQKKI